MTSGADIQGVVLDTSAYSWFRRGEPQIVEVVATTPVAYLPTVVIGELLAGFGLGQRQRDNEAVLKQFLAEDFVAEIQVDARVAPHYARIFGDLRRAGTPIPTNDIWIAACARSRGLPLATFDRDFLQIGAVDCLLLSVDRLV
jgi:tRNA(fMet)-specific endonuclease VapC